jgi:hypothetical protein
VRPACAAPTPTPKAPWRATSSKSCWPWKIGERFQRLRQAPTTPDLADSPERIEPPAADLAEIRYREGTADFLVLLDAQRERLAAEDTQAQAEVDLYRGIVAIYKALGGGWQPETVASN